MMDTATARSLSSQPVALLSYFSLEPDQYPQPLTKVRLLSRWLQAYPQEWVRCALIESLYQGRYKTYCVEQILSMWHRRGQPIHHFNHEFETMICSNVPQRQENALLVDSPINSVVSDQVSRLNSKILQGSGVLHSENMSEDMTESPEFSTGSKNKGQVLDPTSADIESSDRDWANAFEWPIANMQKSDLSSVLSRNQLLPLMLNRIGLVPIHRFMPEAEPVEFCERLAAIASSFSAVTPPESAKARR